MDRPRDELTPGLQEDQVHRLLNAAGMAGPFTLHPLPGGGNNRVYRLEKVSGPLLVKSYFRHPADRRDRLRNEFAFTTFAWDRGVRSVPQPLASLPEDGLGLYEYIVGERVRPGEVSANDVEQALAFYRDLNRHRGHPAARSLAPGSEACFSLNEHLATVDRRLARLRAWPPMSDLDLEARAFLDDSLVRRWEEVRQTAWARAGELGLDADKPLAAEVRRLSPSDFGFHNALREPSGGLRFFDFEYAGWDDPAKLVGDFFCQPAVPVPRSHHDPFVAEVVADLPDPDRERQRIKMLREVYGMKWVAILLNEFLPVSGDRRRFAQPVQDVDERKREQLAKARKALAAVVAEP